MMKKILLLAACLLLPQLAAADSQGSFARLFQQAVMQGKAGNAFAAGYACSTANQTTTCTSPQGGSVTQNYSQWSGTSGSATWSYNNFTISAAGITMVITGSFTYNGSVQPNGFLDGTLVGNLIYDIKTPTTSYGGYNIPAQTVHANVGITAQFQASGAAAVTLNINGTPMTVNWSQTQLLGYLY
ncbi:MAG: hypothetical protein K8F27_07100 [Sulfuricellaceae bacterium]|nr:hypothetical protein [Sulfuricellaceae bacterium]